MPVVNPLSREVVFKVVYYGPGLGGKTTSLQHIHATTRPEQRGKMVSLATPVDRTLYFDFLPIRLPNVHGMGVRLQLFTVPGQVYYNATRKLVLTGADGVVLVFDSQGARSDANSESLENLHENLTAHGRSLSDVPHVIQYNKRDLYDALPLDALEQRHNRLGAPAFGSVAMTGEGIYEALEAVTRWVLEQFEARLPTERGATAPGLELPEAGLAEAFRAADTPERAEPQLSFELLWPAAERGLVRELERALATGDHGRAVAECETLVARALAGAAAALGTSDAPRDPATVALVLGIDGRRYLEFRNLAREARAGRGISATEALLAYALSIELRIARAGVS